VDMEWRLNRLSAPYSGKQTRLGATHIAGQNAAWRAFRALQRCGSKYRLGWHKKICVRAFARVLERGGWV